MRRVALVATVVQLVALLFASGCSRPPSEEMQEVIEACEGRQSQQAIDLIEEATIKMNEQQGKLFRNFDEVKFLLKKAKRVCTTAPRGVPPSPKPVQLVCVKGYLFAYYPDGGGVTQVFKQYSSGVPAECN